MWLSRLFAVYCSIMFILPLLGWVMFFYKALSQKNCNQNFKKIWKLSGKLMIGRWIIAFSLSRPQAANNFYQRALLANALTSALRLHQRLPRFQLSRAFLAQALQEDSCHYLLYSLILVNSHPITSILSQRPLPLEISVFLVLWHHFVFMYPWLLFLVSIFPVFLFSVLHATTYTKKVLDVSLCPFHLYCWDVYLL